ncbi:hypothetical protein HAHE_16710 [Haloferula helveola]|uniref:Uncharacterized protein n=2 Tax=Haloferula helveola TaxID=490095 RepID=A0ABM7RDP1_9BACT|nr:hypothetical protein HAHE_16710 [Haloferula helveola]
MEGKSQVEDEVGTRMESSAPVPDMVARDSNARGRAQRVGLAILSLYTLACVWIGGWLLLLQTDPTWILSARALSILFIAAFATLPLMLAYSVGVPVARGVKRCCKVAGSWPTWLLAMVLPVAGVVALLTPTALDRIFPQRIFERLTGVEMPAEARLVGYENSSDIIEQHITIEFEASDTEIWEMVRRMGVRNLMGTGVDTFRAPDAVGDMCELRIDWFRGRVVMEYLDV